MQLDRPWAKFWSKSYSNRLLINFFDLNLAVRSIVATISIQFRSTIGWNRSILIDNWSIYIDNIIFFDIYRRFWLINQHLVNLNRLKDWFYIEKDWFKSKIDQFYIVIAIVDSIKSLESKSTIINDQIWFSDSMTTIWFATPNRISLPASF